MHRQRLVSIVGGLLLLTAAALKTYALLSGATAATALFASPRWQIALIDIEVILGLWLLIGLWPRGAWLTAIVAFSLFAIASLYLALAGQRSCGCFGKVTVNPWVTFVLDVVIVVCFCWWSPRPLPLRTLLGESAQSWPSRRLYFAGGIITVLLACCYLLSHSSFPVLVFLRGESLTLEPNVLEIGSGIRGEVRDCAIEIRNHTDRDVRLVGGRVGCRCIDTDELPLTLSPLETRTLRMKVRFLSPPGSFEYSYFLSTDDESHPVVTARVGGYVLETPGR